jgi:hypothetical protein
MPYDDKKLTLFCCSELWKNILRGSWYYKLLHSAAHRLSFDAITLFQSCILEQTFKWKENPEIQRLFTTFIATLLRSDILLFRKDSPITLLTPNIKSVAVVFAETPWTFFHMEWLRCWLLWCPAASVKSIIISHNLVSRLRTFVAKHLPYVS